MTAHAFQVDEIRSGFGECDKCGELRDHPDHASCETPECAHRCCSCGHAECGHANENVQPNCSDCDCDGFDDGACLECGAGSDEQCDMNCGDDDED